MQWLLSYSTVVAQISVSLFMFFLIWSLLVCGALFEAKVGQDERALHLLKSFGKKINLIVCFAFLPAIALLIWQGADAIELTYLFVSPWLVVGAVICWQFGERVFSLTPVPSRKEKRTKIRKYVEAFLLLAFLLVVHRLGF